MLTVSFKNGLNAELSITPNIINLVYENSSTKLSCFINGNIEDFLMAHINKDDRDMLRDKILELIYTKEKNLHWLNNGTKMTALQYAELYLNVQGVENCKKIIERATAKGLHKGIFFPDENIHKRINLVFLKKALQKLNA